jgi:hypothetical protein
VDIDARDRQADAFAHRFVEAHSPLAMNGDLRFGHVSRAEGDRLDGMPNVAGP